MGVLTRWREYARQYGALGLVRHVGARLLRPIWERSHMHLLVLEATPPRIEARAPLHVGELGPERAQETALAGPDWAERWAHGDRCYGGWRDGQLVHHSWVTRNDSYIAEIRGWVKPGSDEAYIYDCFTDGSCRGLGIFPAVLSTVSGILFDQGVRRVWIAVEAENLSSRKAIERAGFRLACTVSYSRLAGSVHTDIRAENGMPPCPIA
jgi:ribosomal protein S18 acetylase RimI-like enzyme